MKTTEAIKQKFPDAVTDSHQKLGDETVFVNRNRIHEVLKFLRDDPEMKFNLLLDLCGVDYLGQTLRFEVVYHLYSLATKARIRIRVQLHENEASVKSCMDIWEAADWFEREAFDMYGIHFEGHPNLKRLMMWEGFKGHPQRKDYPIDQRQPIPESLDIV